MTHCNVAFVDLEEVVRGVSGRQLLEILLQECTPSDKTRASGITMIDEGCADAVDVIDVADNIGGCVVVSASHLVAAPRYNPIGRIMRMAGDQI